MRSVERMYLRRRCSDNSRWMKPFLPRDAYAQRGIYRGKMPVRPSVRLSHAGIESKRLYISSQFLHRRVALPF